MTIVAGFLCPDGFVISADTEITHHQVRYQSTKVVQKFRKGTDPAYWLVMAGAGNGDYLEMVMQEIASRVDGLPDPSVSFVQAEIQQAINELHDATLFPMWEIEPEQRELYSVSVVVGLRDPSDQVAMWRTADKAVTRVASNGSVFVGTGDYVAHYVGETLFQSGLPVAVVHHLATQIVQEARIKGEYVGGNIDTCSIKRTSSTAPYFSLPDHDLYLWGLEDTLNSAVRCALSGRTDHANARLASIARTIVQLCEMAKTPTSQDTEWHTTQIMVPHTHPFRDI